MSETFVHLAPTRQVAHGHGQGSLVEAMRASLDRDSRRQLQLLAADQGQRRGSGQRRPRPGGAEDLRHRSRRDEDDARAVRRVAVARCRASSTSGSIATRACRSCRSFSIARRWRAPASTSMRRRTSSQTALGGQGRRPNTGRTSGPCRCASMFPVAEREDEARDRRHPRAVGQTAGTCRCARSRASRRRVGRAAINREANSRVLALKFNVEGRDIGSVVTDAQAAVKRDVKVPEGNYLVVGRRVREPEARAGAAGGDRPVLVPGRVRAAVHGARLASAARSRCSRSRRSR